MPAESQHLAQKLQNWFEPFPEVIVALSGGVDSAIVAQAAFIAKGLHAKAVTAVSPSLAASEQSIAKQIARQIGISHTLLSTDELSQEGYRENSFNRCYFCKSTLYDTILKQDWQGRLIVNGANADDASDHRPGMKAAKEFNVRSPLLELGYNKQTVRQIAQFYELPIWNKPASPCLSSRIAYGVPVTAERLQQIEQAEAYLKHLTENSNLRVRLLAGNKASLEFTSPWIAKLSEPATALQIEHQLKAFGFAEVSIDPEGFRSGKLNQQIPADQLVQIDGQQP